jgi:hypothetical protein
MTKADESATLRFEPFCELRVLRACKFCGSAHPLSLNPPIESDLCLQCNMPVQQPEMIEAGAIAA